MSLTAYKKQVGILKLIAAKSLLTWIPKDGQNEGPILLQVSNISNLQQTPAASSKIMLKICYSVDQAETVTYTFTFITSDAREQADSIKSSLATALRAARIGVAGTIYDDSSQLLQDDKLQKQVLTADPALQKTFTTSMAMRSSETSAIRAASQFWSSRLHLLREYSMIQNQKRGSYNILAALKPIGEESIASEQPLTITKEQVQLIYNQYPIVEQIHNCEVPPLKELEFWSRFFQSRLYKRLKGLKITAIDPADKVLDGYLDEEVFKGHAKTYKVPRIFDLEGNQEDHSQQQAVQLQLTKNQHLMRSFNSLSGSILAKTTPLDIQQEEATLNILLLRDLQTLPEQERPILRIRDQDLRFTEPSQPGKLLDLLTKANSEAVFPDLQKDLEDRFPSPCSSILYSRETLDDSSSCDRSLQASSHISELLGQSRLRSQPIPESMGFSVTIYDHIRTSHAAVTELLKQFWSAFLSGSPERSSEIILLAECVHRLKEYIEDIAQKAEDEGDSQMSAAKRKAHEIEERSGQTVRIDYHKTPVGTSGVKRLFQSTSDSISKAIDQYKQIAS
ncbi:putative rna polymerase ii transcription factor [Phaeomoniella chlamydospora]|uniref:Putative rna polymerase ii transcription factor n=1 Tax=Phaeomoniella chlamydospora TaxID=158046 RepID=A0A0G2EIX9_PHACM|nr:putative rna polymerase ii transcription factor [Phaeomoniella chlamydospora]